MSSSLACTIVITLCGLGDGQAIDTGVLSWQQVEHQIDWHRNHVRACGPLSVIRSLQLLGHRVDTAAVLAPLTAGDPRGIPLRQVLQSCRDYEPHARLVHVAPSRWRQLVPPCILIVNEGRHALVLQALSPWRGEAEIWDPSVMQVRTVKLKQLGEIWSGDAILLQRPPRVTWGLCIMNVAIAIWLLFCRHARNGAERGR